MEYIGERNCCLFAVPNKIELYRNELGFKLQAKQHMIIYFGKVSQKIINSNEIKIETMISEELIEKVIDYDRRIHGSNREKLLRLSVKEEEWLALTALDSITGIVVGYGCIRENSEQFATLSPVYANCHEIAVQLCETLINSNEFAIKNGFFYYTISTNESAIRCAEELQLEKHEECPLLFKNSIIEVDYQKVYSIFSPNFSI